MSDKLNIKYRILEVDEIEHRFTVRYYTDILTEELLNVNRLTDDLRLGEDGKPERCRTDISLTMYNPDADEEEVNKFIQMNAPAEWMKLLERGYAPRIQSRGVAKTKAIGHLKNKLKKDHEFEYVPPESIQIPLPPPPPSEPTPEILTDEEVQSLLSKLKKKK